MSSSRLEHYFQDYAAHHRSRGNQVCHSVGIPMITASLLGLLSHLTLGSTDPDAWLRPDAGLALIAAALLWYVLLEWRLAVTFAFFVLGLYFVGRALPLTALWTIFVLGWVLQLVGHSRYERNRPAFLKNLTHVLIGPLWVFAKLTRYRHPS